MRPGNGIESSSASRFELFLPFSRRPKVANRTFGLLLFLVYLADYFAFVALNAFAPAVMETEIWQGINLATAWGFGLISVALGLAIIYGCWCAWHPESKESDPEASHQPEATGGP